MDYQQIMYDVRDNVAVLTLNRPDKYNAFTDAMIGEITDAFKKAGRDPAVRAILLTGAGRGFCAGQDLGDVGGRDVSFEKHLRHRYNPMILRIRRTEKPVIGAINGAAAGAGMSLALATDLRVMSDKASLIFAAFARVGLVPDNGASYFLPRLVGPSKALELFLLADAQQRVSPEEALRLNLVTAVYEAESFMDSAMELATRLAAMPTKALGLTKRMLNITFDYSLEEMLDIEAQLQEAASRTDDHQEGLTAFLEKRSPAFTGQ